MSEWKELKIDDLPSDILTGDYEFSFIYGGAREMYTDWFLRENIILHSKGEMDHDGCYPHSTEVYYRKSSGILPEASK